MLASEAADPNPGVGVAIDAGETNPVEADFPPLVTESFLAAAFVPLHERPRRLLAIADRPDFGVAFLDVRKEAFI